MRLARQQIQKSLHVVGLEGMLGVELPEERSELVAQFGHATVDEAPDVRSSVCQHAPLRDEARRLDREHEVLRRRVVPLGKDFGLLQSVERAVDLDRGDLAARIVELVLLAHVRWIERLAPGFVAPSADADPNATVLSHMRPDCPLEVGEDDGPAARWKVISKASPELEGA